MIVRALLDSPVGKSLIGLVAGILVIVIATAYGQIVLNRWNKPFSTPCRARLTCVSGAARHILF